MFDNLKEDLKRFSVEDCFSIRVCIAGILSPGFQAITVYRFFNWCHRWHIPTQPLRYFVERLIEITTGISIPACCKIGKGLRIHHFGGIIFHPDTVVGDYCTIYQGVTFGDRGGYGGAPTVCNNVLIGTGAKLIGDIRVEDNCKVGANVVLNTNMEKNTMAIVNPCYFKTIDD